MFSAGFIIIMGQLFPYIPTEIQQLLTNLTESRLLKMIRKLQIHKTKHWHFISKYEAPNSVSQPSPHGECHESDDFRLDFDLNTSDFINTSP